jgi:4-hydroxy-tetrahydrodipicolinate synthase
MPSAREAREWAARGGLHGSDDSLYTPFSGIDGDDIVWDAYRTLVRHCVRELRHSMLWLTSGIAEWWSLTIDERKRLLEIAVDEARSVAPATVIQACTSAASAKDTLELTLHAQEHGADICYPQIPPMEVHGIPARLIMKGDGPPSPMTFQMCSRSSDASTSRTIRAVCSMRPPRG